MNTKERQLIVEKARLYTGGHQNYLDITSSIRTAKILPAGWQVIEDIWGRDHRTGNLPKNSISIGSYRVRAHDPSNGVYLVPSE